MKITFEVSSFEELEELSSFLSQQVKAAKTAAKVVDMDSLNLCMRTRVSLRDGGVETLEELLTKRPRELLRMTNIGSKALQEIRVALALVGLSLKEF